LRYASLVALADEDSDPATFTAGSTAPTMKPGKASVVWGDEAKPSVFSTLGWRLCCLSPENGAEPEGVVSSPLTGPLSLGGSLSLTLPLSEEIPWPYNRPFPFHRLVLGSTQRNFPFGAGVVVINSDGVGNLKVAVVQ
jgi:hypothetical protein